MGRIGIVLVIVAVAACTPRGTIRVVPEAAGVGDRQEIFLGTTRGRDATGEFDAERSAALTFARYEVSVPPDRTAGEIRWPPRRGEPDPRRQFVTISRETYAGEAPFRSDLARALARQGGEAVVFVHGYNSTFAEGTYRLAQMAHDLNLPGTLVHYSWPSAAEPLGYAHDRDSALFARDGLETVLQDLTAAGAKRVILVAHSMGGALTMETLRQIALRRNTEVMGRIRGVVLISPDIDVDVFHAQAKAIPKLPQPFIVFTSERDRVLKLSARLSGETDRLGTLTDLSRVADLPITFLDTVAFNSGAGHFNVGNSPALLALLRQITSVDRALGADQAGRTGLLPGVVLTVQNATQIILQPVAEIGTAR